MEYEPDSIAPCVTITRDGNGNPVWSGAMVCLPCDAPSSPPLIMPDVASAIALVRNDRKAMTGALRCLSVIDDWHNLTHKHSPFCTVGAAELRVAVQGLLPVVSGRLRAGKRLRSYVDEALTRWEDQCPWRPIELTRASMSLMTHPHWDLVANWRRWFKGCARIEDQWMEYRRHTKSKCTVDAYRKRLAYVCLPASETAYRKAMQEGDLEEQL